MSKRNEPSSGSRIPTCPITKRRLLILAIKPMVIVGAVSGSLIFTLIVALYFRYGVLTFYEHILIGFISALFICFFITGLCFPLAIKGISIINKQEAFFGFRFDDEMKRKQVGNIDFMCEEWFLDVNLCRIIALNRRYIRELIANKNAPSPKLAKVDMVLSDGSTLTLTGARYTIKKLELWYESTGTDRD